MGGRRGVAERALGGAGIGGRVAHVRDSVITGSSRFGLFAAHQPGNAPARDRQHERRCAVCLQLCFA
ncbi:hypothetical protein PATSB16_28500 [Pandoraea thiooxydans]|nr:hypothetical protein PATSB16_28500 [Pandoraea thiooxydans]